MPLFVILACCQLDVYWCCGDHCCLGKGELINILSFSVLARVICHMMSATIPLQDFGRHYLALVSGFLEVFFNVKQQLTCLHAAHFPSSPRSSVVWHRKRRESFAGGAYCCPKMCPWLSKNVSANGKGSKIFLSQNDSHMFVLAIDLK